MKTFIVRFEEKAGEQTREELKGEFEYIEFETKNKRDCIRVRIGLEMLYISSRNNILTVIPESSNKIGVSSIPYGGLRLLEELYYGKKSEALGIARGLPSNPKKDKKALSNRSRSRKN